LKKDAPAAEPSPPEPEPRPKPEPPTDPVPAGPRLEVRIRERHAAVQALHAQGMGLRTIARELDLDRKTVRRFTQAADPEDLLVKTLSRSALLDAYKPHLNQRWNEGRTDVEKLFAEITQLGYRGSIRTVYRYLQPLRATGTAPTSNAVPPPKIRHITGWMMRRPDALDPDEQAKLTDVRTRCPHLDRLAGHVTDFAKMLTQRSGAQDLAPWLERVEADDQPELHSFARGIRQDLAAVTNGLSLPYNSGACEGNVNRLKALKRQMFGRAGLDLLRKRMVPHDIDRHDQ
jgi:transposase